MLRTMDITMQLARDHHAEGERFLAIGRDAVREIEHGIRTDAPSADVVQAMAVAGGLVALATAHFAASVSATNFLLTADTSPVDVHVLSVPA